MPRKMDDGFHATFHLKRVHLWRKRSVDCSQNIHCKKHGAIVIELTAAKIQFRHGDRLVSAAGKKKVKPDDSASKVDETNRVPFAAR